MTKIAISVLFFFIFSKAEDNKSYCSDLYSISCASGDTYDSSGKVSTGLSSLRIDQIVDEKMPAVKKEFLEVIRNPENKYFKNIAQKTLGYSNSPECKFDDSKSIELCNLKISEGLATLSGIIATKESNIKNNFKATAEDWSRLTSNLNFQNVYKNFKSDILSKLENKELKKKIETQLFPDAKKILIKKIQDMTIENKTKELMIEKIRSIKYGGVNCSDDISLSIDGDLIPNAQYVTKKNAFSICDGLLLRGQSDFHLMFVIAHELSHSIDPCGIQDSYNESIQNFSDEIKMAEKQYALPNLIKCLRDSDSIEASRKEKKLWDLFDKKTKSKVFCQNDQIGESIADWFSMEVTSSYIESKFPQLTKPEALSAISNIWKPLCQDSDQSHDAKSFNVHPPDEDRVNRLFLANPKIRQFLGCNNILPKYGYCNGENPKPEKFVSGKIKSSIGNVTK